MNKKVIVDTHLIDEMILDILLQWKNIHSESYIFGEKMKKLKLTKDEESSIRRQRYWMYLYKKSRKTMKGGNKNE